MTKIKVRIIEYEGGCWEVQKKEWFDLWWRPITISYGEGDSYIPAWYIEKEAHEFARKYLCNHSLKTVRERNIVGERIVTIEDVIPHS